jgi:hypothetical protein
MERRFDRIAAAAGLVFVAITLGAVTLYPNLQPPYDEAAVRAAYIDGAAAASWSAVLHLLGTIPFSVFLVAVWQRLRRTDEALATMTLLGGLATMVVITVWQAVLVGLIVQANFVDAAADFRPILAVSTGLDQSVTTPLAIMTGAAGAAILTDRAIPRWLGWLSIVTGGLALIGVMAIVIAFVDRAAGYIVGAANPIAYLLFLVWVGGVSVVFARTPRRSA